MEKLYSVRYPHPTISNHKMSKIVKAIEFYTLKQNISHDINYL
jgi:Holliday junction resolvase-like predicted endonuclease